jgi:hypothetical protein
MKTVWQRSIRRLQNQKGGANAVPLQTIREVDTKVDREKEAKEDLSAARSLRLCEVLAPSWAWRISHH